MELKDYTTEELRAEIKRRAEIARAQKAEEMKAALRCRNCKHCMLKSNSPSWYPIYFCNVRTYGKKIQRHYKIELSTKACDKFERNDY